MANPIECLLDIDKDMVSVLLVLRVLLAETSEVVYLLCVTTHWHTSGDYSLTHLR